MDVLGFAALVVGGFTACAEFGSYAFVHPVIRRLPATYHLQVEQGLLRTFGRVMPVLMTATLALGVANAGGTGGHGGPSGWRWAAAGAYIAALTSTVILKPFWEHSPRPYPVIDFIAEKHSQSGLAVSNLFS